MGKEESRTIGLSLFAMALVVSVSPPHSIATDLPTSGHHGGDRYDPLSDCAGCHGEDLDGAPYGTMTAPSCYDCHGDVWTGTNRPPVPEPGGPYVATLGEAVLFDASGSIDPDGDTLSYAWEFGDGSPPQPASLDPTATHIYDEAGSYAVELFVTDEYTDPVVVSLTLEVTAAPLPPGDTWIVHITTSHPETFAITIEDHDGALVVLKDDGVNPKSLGIGVEFVGVIFWMDVSLGIPGKSFLLTGNAYFATINRTLGTIVGVVFDNTGGVGSLSGTKGW
jgi:hypothetical protein